MLEEIVFDRNASCGLTDNNDQGHFNGFDLRSRDHPERSHIANAGFHLVVIYERREG